MENSTENGQLRLTRDFWNLNPCDGQSTLNAREEFRYTKEPWLLPILRKIGNHSTSILEVGCGQGTDAIIFCESMKAGGQYIGIDYSQESVKAAEVAAKEADLRLKVKPRFQVGNAESLAFESNSIECVYSMGVLHHTPDTQGAIDEIFRVLKPGGRAYIFLYRTASPKLLAAHFLRMIQKGLDKVFGTDRILFHFFRRLSTNTLLGTAVQECFGVPILRSYTRNQLLQLFRSYKSAKIEPQGSGLPPVGVNRFIDKHLSGLGYLWSIEVEK